MTDRLLIEDDRCRGIPIPAGHLSRRVPRSEFFGGRPLILAPGGLAPLFMLGSAASRWFLVKSVRGLDEYVLSENGTTCD
jgi:hypothetical protein